MQVSGGGEDMFVDLFNRLSEPLVASSLSGSMIYTLSQSSFAGMARVIAFIVSFIMGIAGADLTSDILSEYLPNGIRGGQNMGAFICSTLIVTLAVKFISYMENDSMKKKMMAVKDDDRE